MLAHLLLDLAAFGEERLKPFGLDAEVGLRQRQRRAQQPGQRQPLVPVVGREQRVVSAGS